MNYVNGHINQEEMKKLIVGLNERGIAFTLKSFQNGLQVIAYHEGTSYDWDAICHEGSYGGKEGLIEVMGLPQCADDVIGWLHANEVLKMLDEL